jgi:hypothetical protein
MEIFESEIADGLENQIKASASIVYASVAEPSSDNNFTMAEIKSLGSVSDKDLYYVQSILVSSSWNKNDDIFDKREIWLAKNTPEDKPTNLNHDENLIIGHITANWPITEEGTIIDEDIEIDNLPDKFHILTGSVIYKGFSKPELRDRSNRLIEEIENGTKYVSMECFFKGFDYGLINRATNEYKILRRNNDTAYLSKHLRAYGGLGEYNNYKIGRVLRDITFSGKGFVDKPANPDSIIFTKHSLPNLHTEKNNNFSENSVSNDQTTPEVENNIMNLDLEPVMTEVTTIKTKLEAMEGCSDLVKEAYASVDTLKGANIELEGVLAETRQALEESNLQKEEAAKKMDEEMKKKQEEMMKMKAELDSALEAIAAYKMKEEQMAKKEKKMKRMAALIEAGVESESADATAEQFNELNDELFATMTTLLAAKKSSMKKEEQMMMKKPKASENTDTSVLEEVEVTEAEVELGVGGEQESVVDNTRAELVEFVCARLGKKLNKGE